MLTVRRAFKTLNVIVELYTLKQASNTRKQYTTMVAWYGVWQAAESLNTEVKLIYKGELNTIQEKWSN